MRVLVAGDTQPFLNIALTRAGLAEDLTGHVVTALVHRPAPLATLTKATTAVGDPALGIVRLDWDPGDIALPDGAVSGQLIIECSIDGAETTPHVKHFRVRAALP